MFNSGGTLQAFCITAQADHSNYVPFRRMDVWHKQCIGECVRVAVISVVSFWNLPSMDAPSSCDVCAGPPVFYWQTISRLACSVAPAQDLRAL